MKCISTSDHSWSHDSTRQSPTRLPAASHAVDGVSGPIAHRFAPMTQIGTSLSVKSVEAVIGISLDSYALAVARNEPLRFVGDDFARTDVPVARW